MSDTQPIVKRTLTTGTGQLLATVQFRPTVQANYRHRPLIVGTLEVLDTRGRWIGGINFAQDGAVVHLPGEGNQPLLAPAEYGGGPVVLFNDVFGAMINDMTPALGACFLDSKPTLDKVLGHMRNLCTEWLKNDRAAVYDATPQAQPTPAELLADWLEDRAKLAHEEKKPRDLSIMIANAFASHVPGIADHNDGYDCKPVVSRNFDQILSVRFLPPYQIPTAEQLQTFTDGLALFCEKQGLESARLQQAEGPGAEKSLTLTLNKKDAHTFKQLFLLPIASPRRGFSDAAFSSN